MAVLDRVPLDDITGEAQRAQVGRMLATIVAGVLYGLGWLVSRTLRVLWLAAVWSVTAVKVGCRDGWSWKASGG